MSGGDVVLEAHDAVGVAIVDENVRVAPLVLDPHGGGVQVELDLIVHLTAGALEIRVVVDPLGDARLEREVGAERRVHHARHVEERGADVLAGGVRRPERRRLPVRIRHVGEDSEQDHALHRQALTVRILGGEAKAEHGHLVEFVSVGPGRESLRELDRKGVAHHDLAVHGVDGEVASQDLVDLLTGIGPGVLDLGGVAGLGAVLDATGIVTVLLRGGERGLGERVEGGAAGGEGEGGEGQEGTEHGHSGEG